MPTTTEKTPTSLEKLKALQAVEDYYWLTGDLAAALDDASDALSRLTALAENPRLERSADVLKREGIDVTELDEKLTSFARGYDMLRVASPGFHIRGLHGVVDALFVVFDDLREDLGGDLADRLGGEEGGDDA